MAGLILLKGGLRVLTCHEEKCKTVILIFENKIELHLRFKVRPKMCQFFY